MNTITAGGSRWREWYVGVVQFGLIFLFVYTAMDKAVHYERNVMVMARMPWLRELKEVVAIAVPTAEVVAVALLLVPATVVLGLRASLILMIIFTSYLFVMLVSGASLPCTCGGVLQSMSWMEHLVFNVVVLALILVALNVRKGGECERFGGGKG